VATGDMFLNFSCSSLPFSQNGIYAANIVLGFKSGKSAGQRPHVAGPQLEIETLARGSLPLAGQALGSWCEFASAIYTNPLPSSSMCTGDGDYQSQE
jgi:hypothetical protein